MSIVNQNFNREMFDLQAETKFCFRKIFHLKFLFQIFCCFYEFSRVLTRFKSLIYTVIIANPVSNFLIKMHGRYLGLFAYPSFNKYSLRRLYHMRLDYFNPYSDRCII